MNRDLPPGELETVREALRRGNKIEAIKRYREATGLGLKESKEAVEAMDSEGGPAGSSPLAHKDPFDRKKAGCFGILATLVALALLLALAGAARAADVPPHIARGHLLAGFCAAGPAEKPKRIAAIYREIIPVAAPPGSYTTVAFAGGYVGLAGNKDGTGGSTVNFSIWGNDAVEAEPADKKHGAIPTRQFTHEGTGWAGRLAYPWKVGRRYQVFVHVTHEGENTVFSAWFGEAERTSGCSPDAS